MKRLFAKKDEERKGELILKGFDERLVRRADLIHQIEKLTAEKEQIEQELKSFMGNAEVAHNDKYYVSFKTVISSRIDTKRLKEERPEIYRKFQKENCSRRLTIKMA